MRHFALLGVIGGLCACSSRAPGGGFADGARSVSDVRLAVVSEDTRVALGAMSQKASLDLRTRYAKQVDQAPPPVQLVPTDGSELGLVALAAKVDIDGPLARTELHFSFKNAEARQREGRFAVTLPPNASIARFAMKIGDAWREARVVSRTRGRQVYETIMKGRRDPALLERDLGNQFSARVFPIAPNEQKEIVIAYEHAVGEVQPYVLALRGLPAVPTLTVDIDRDGVRSLVDQSRRTPEDVLVPIGAGSTAIAAGESFVARVELPSGSATAALDRVLILVDTSASRATVMGTQASAVRAILATLPANAEVIVSAYDQEITELYRGDPAHGIDVVGRLFDLGALGASDLGAALAYAATTHMDRVVLIGDGMPTLGEREPGKLAALAKGITRLDALQVGATIDRDSLGPIVAAGDHPGAILDGRDLGRATRQLATAITAERRISVDGATAWPATTRGVAPGDPVWVFGRRRGKGALRVHVGNAITAIAPATSKADDHRVKRAVAGAEVASLTDELARTTGDAAQQAIAKRIEEVALANSLVSMQTSLIVLESDADEQRFLGSQPVEITAAQQRGRTFQQALGTAAGSQSDAVGVTFDGSTVRGGETIVIDGTAPTIDPTSTSQGITIDRNYIRNIPVAGRTFEASGVDTTGVVNFSGSTSIENRYIVDGVSVEARSRGSFRVKADVMSPLANEYIAQSIRAGGMFVEPDPEEEADRPAPPPAPVVADDSWSHFTAPHEGTYLAVREAVRKGNLDFALEVSAPAELANPGDITLVLALGEALEARGAYALAARAYGSLMDLYPNRAEFLRAAGQRLDELATKLPAARDLAIAAYRRAIAERPDHAHTYRLLALSLLLANTEAADAEVLPTLRTGAAKSTDAAVLAVLSEDRAVAEAVLAARHPERAKELLGTTPVELATKPSLRIILAWETDANDVDLHVRDRSGAEAFFSSPTLASGGKLLQDITQGFGPEMFTIIDPKAFPYRIAVHYYTRGPMGIGLGTVQSIQHDGAGHLTVQQAPFVIQADQALVELPTIR